MLPLCVARPPRHRLDLPTPILLLPETEITPNGRFRHYALDIDSSELSRFKGCAKSCYTGITAGMLGASAPSEFLLPLDLFVFLPCLVVSFCAATNLLPPPPLRMPLLGLYTDHSLSVLVSVTSFTSPVLLKRTRLQITYFYWPDNRNTRKTFRLRVPLL